MSQGSRLAANAVLQERIRHRLKQPVGCPPKYARRFYEDFEYQAKIWGKPRGVVAKIEGHSCDLFPRVGFVVTNLPMEPEWVIGFYNRRGTAEQHIREGRWTRLSCRGLRDNEVRLQLHALAYNLAVFLAHVGLPKPMADWSPTTLQIKLIKIGARVVWHARAITFPAGRGCRVEADAPRYHGRLPPAPSTTGLVMTMAPTLETKGTWLDQCVRGLLSIGIHTFGVKPRPVSGLSAVPDRSQTTPQLQKRCQRAVGTASWPSTRITL